MFCVGFLLIVCSAYPKYIFCEWFDCIHSFGCYFDVGVEQAIFQFGWCLVMVVVSVCAVGASFLYPNSIITMLTLIGSAQLQVGMIRSVGLGCVWAAFWLWAVFGAIDNC